MLPEAPTPLTARIVNGVTELSEAEWTECLPQDAEGWRYYRACERVPSKEGPIAAEVRDDKGLLIAAPLFKISYRLDTPLQGSMGRFGAWLAAKFPRFLEWPLLGVGSPYADRGHIAIRPGLSPEEKSRAVKALIGLVESEAKRIGAPLVAYKDLSGQEHALLASSLLGQSYSQLRSLPIATLGIPDTSWESYLSSLSPSTRKDVRRKLKSASKVTIEHRIRLDGVVDEVRALYESTRRNSAVRYGNFEELPDGYFEAVSEELRDRVLFVLYWIEGQLAAFNLLLLERDRVIDKFLGMAYPLARENNLYVVSWMENVRLCIKTGRTTLQSGQTAYASKLRLGSQLVPSWIFVKHRNPFLNRLIGWAAPLIAFDRWDPDLKLLKSSGKSQDAK